MHSTDLTSPPLSTPRHRVQCCTNHCPIHLRYWLASASTGRTCQEWSGLRGCVGISCSGRPRGAAEALWTFGSSLVVAVYRVSFECFWWAALRWLTGCVCSRGLSHSLYAWTPRMMTLEHINGYCTEPTGDRYVYYADPIDLEPGTMDSVRAGCAEAHCTRA